MFNTNRMLGMLAGSLLFGSRMPYRPGRALYKSGEGLNKLNKMMGALYGDENKRFKKWEARQGPAPVMPAPQADFAQQPFKRPSLNVKSVSGEPAEKEEDIDETPPSPSFEEEEREEWFIEIPEEEMENTIAIRAIRSMIAAAYADGALADEEKKLIEDRIGSLPENEAVFIRIELSSPKPISQFASGVTDEDERRLIFGLAVAVMKADKRVEEGENKFARELAKALKLSKDSAMEIIKSAGSI